MIFSENAVSVVLVQEKQNPSTDYFLLPLLQGKYERVDIVNHDVNPVDICLEGKLLIFVRYVPKNWKHKVEQDRGYLADVVFFMDDDLLDFKAFSGLPFKYQLKLLKLSYIRKYWLKKIGVKLWVSTAYLMKKYADRDPFLVLPKPNLSSLRTIRIFYHGSASHSREIEWLYPVIKQVLKKNSELSFEIVGDNTINKLFRSLPRTAIIHPMSWSAYQSFISQKGRSIGLAPLHDVPFNSARSYTKFFDITQAGAVGIYAKHDSFNGVIKNKVNGVLVDMIHNDWVDAILTLAADEPMRMRMVDEARKTCRQLASHKVDIANYKKDIS